MCAFISRYRTALVFGAKMLAVYVVWYVVYDLYLLPDGRVDAWLSYVVAEQATALLAAGGWAPLLEGRVVRLEDAAGVLVQNGCNGLSCIGLFAGFVLSYPGRLLRRALFIPAGVLVIHLTNVTRVAALPVLQVHWTHGFDVLHGLGTYLFYAVIFCLWVAWMHLGGLSTATARRKSTDLMPASA